MTTALVLPEPATITPAQIPEFCRAVEAEALATDDPTVVAEMHARWSALTQYLAVKSRDGIALARATELRLLARVGELSPRQPGPGRGHTEKVTEPGSLSPNRLTEARHLAAHPDVVDEVIAEGTDEAPPSKAQVIRRIRERMACPPRRLSSEEQERIDIEQADERTRDRLRQAVIGWISIVSLPDNDRRDIVLAGLIDHDRAKVLEIEAARRYFLGRRDAQQRTSGGSAAGGRQHLRSSGAAAKLPTPPPPWRG